jgi:hypothetical protein
MEYDQLKKNRIRIRENSFMARIGAVVLKSRRMAMVIGSTIHLYNISREAFLADESWVKHELCHIAQYRQYGRAGFILRYMFESIRKGYYHNRFEAEARKAESNTEPFHLSK